jgi:hypothetical protein
VLLARDPWWLFAHWEIPPVRRVEALRALGADGETTREVLRVTAADSSTVQDVELEPGSVRAHVHVEGPGRSYRIDVGLRAASGRFVSLVTSNLTTTPPAHPSPSTEVQWVTLGVNGRTMPADSPWDGRRVAAPDHAGATGGAPDPRVTQAPRGGSSEALPARPGASDALPLR